MLVRAGILTGFLQNWFFTNNYIDIKLARVEKGSGSYTLTIDNPGGFAIPFDVKVVYSDGSTSTRHQTPVTWKENEKQQILKITTKKTIVKIILDGNLFMDYTPKDNVWTSK